MYSVRFATHDDLDQIVALHEKYFYESSYAKFTFSYSKTLATFMAILADTDHLFLVAKTPEGQSVGYAILAFDSPFMDEEIAILTYFYIHPDHRRKKCSQMVLDFALELCEHKGAKAGYASSTAGFPDNGVNERAFRMLLKRNGFNHVGSFLIREF